MNAKEKRAQMAQEAEEKKLKRQQESNGKKMTIMIMESETVPIDEEKAM